MRPFDSLRKALDSFEKIFDDFEKELSEIDKDGIVTETTTTEVERDGRTKIITKRTVTKTIHITKGEK